MSPIRTKEAPVISSGEKTIPSRYVAPKVENIRKKPELSKAVEELKKEPMIDTINSEVAMELEDNLGSPIMKKDPQGKIREMFDEFREEMHKEISNMHIEIVRQFQIQIVNDIINIGRNTRATRKVHCH